MLTVTKIRELLSEYDLDPETETGIALKVDRHLRDAHKAGYAEGYEEAQVES